MGGVLAKFCRNHLSKPSYMSCFPKILIIAESLAALLIFIKVAVNQICCLVSGR